MYSKETFARQLKTPIGQKGYTQRMVAEKLETTETSISRYVSGDRMPDIETVVKLAGVLGVSIDNLVGVEPPAQPRPSPDISILLSCYQRASDADRQVVWSLFDRYMTPEQRVIITAMQSKDGAPAVCAPIPLRS